MTHPTDRGLRRLRRLRHAARRRLMGEVRRLEALWTEEAFESFTRAMVAHDRARERVRAYTSKYRAVLN